MKLERLRIKNYKGFRSAELADLPPFCVIVGANGTGKSILFDVFGFLRDSLDEVVRSALARR